MVRSSFLIVSLLMMPDMAQANLGSLEADRIFKNEIAGCEAQASATAETCNCALLAFERYKVSILAIPFNANDDHYMFYSAEERSEHYAAGLTLYAAHLGCAAFEDD